MSCLRVVLILGLAWGLPAASVAQTSSLGVKNRLAKKQKPPVKPTREKPHRERHLVYETYSWTAKTPLPPKTYRPGDLITIIVRQQRQYEADADLQSRKKWEITSELQAFANIIKGGVGAATFRRGKPTIDYKYENLLRNQGDTSREDRLTTKLAAKIIDVKPNGLLVLEGQARVKHDDEVSAISLTGMCRKEDITADNTILSTQIANLGIVIDNKGALRSTTTRGWIPKLLDWLKPV